MLMAGCEDENVFYLRAQNSLETVTAQRMGGEALVPGIQPHFRGNELRKVWPTVSGNCSCSQPISLLQKLLELPHLKTSSDFPAETSQAQAFISQN